MALSFGRKNDEPALDAPEQPVKEGGKGRPTPTRKEAEAAARAKARTPRTKQELRAREREVRMESSKQIRAAMKSGDERYLPARDRGPMRRFIRDYVDARFSMVEMLIPLLVVTLIIPMFDRGTSTTFAGASALIMMVTFVLVITQTIWLRFRLRRQLVARFPGENYSGTTFYAVTRSLQMKFMRLPKAQVKIGQDLPESYR